MTGLAAQFRDLLMCKNPQTLPLMEITGSLLERYKLQAARCDVQFLFGAIALLTELETGFKTALNQRLHVELGLMKLCGMGQKKSDGLNEAHDELPELKKDITHASRPAAAVAPAAAEVPKPESAPAAETPGPEPAAVAPAPQTASRTAPASVAGIPEPVAAQETAHAPKTVTPQSPPAASPLGSPISGQSIASILSAPKRNGLPEEEAAQHPETTVDPDAEKKIRHFAAKFLHGLQAERPRMAPAFQDMAVNGNRITAVVQSQELHDEIMRNRAELLETLAAVAGVAGMIELKVKIVESSGVKKPIRVEDRLKFLTDKNPVLTKLRKELDFEIE